MSTCPIDREILASNDTLHYRYYSCERCGGIWIPGGLLHRVLSARGVEDLGHIPSMEKSAIHCPDCRTQCDLVTVKDCRLDTCSKCHGVWLDAGEVLRVRSLFPEDSPIVDAEKGRIAGKQLAETGASMSVVEMVGNLLLLIP
ncbi:MAG TPA: zf-TFIIB domain-containing protein [Verrucomicrobiae bacterium]|nr:zf-TFIIB domain-containing protein [Verrucomicrobiae bacterium]